jgi:hypothetical protein
MPTKKPLTGTYKVANPRGIPAGTRIIATDTAEWFEGNPITPADVEGFEELLEQGYVEEVKDNG